MPSAGPIRVPRALPSKGIRRQRSQKVPVISTLITHLRLATTPTDAPCRRNFLGRKDGVDMSAAEI